MRRTLVVISAVLVALGGLTLAGVAQAGDTQASQLQANKTAAQHDARKLLALLRLPNGLRRSAARPRVGGTLVGERSANGRYSAGDPAFWTTDTSPQGIIAYIEAHRPKGSTSEGTGSGTAPGSSSVEAMFTWPPLGSQVYNRTLTVSVISAPGEPSAVVAQSQSDWIVPRSSAEVVPSGVKSVVITLRMGGGPQGLKQPMHISTYVVWRVARVSALVNEFNRLPIVQPGEIFACPLMHIGNASPALTLQFRAGQVQPALARAQVYVTRGSNGYSGWNECDAIQFWIGGKQQTALTSQTFVRQIGRLIGADIS